MSYGTPGQFFTGTTSVSEYGILHHSGSEPASGDYFGQRLGGTNSSGWSYSAAPASSALDLAMDDDWQQLYEAVVNASAIADAAGIEDEGMISNALGFDDIPDLVDPHAWLPDAPLAKLGEPWTSLAPVNSPTEPTV
jgi:hypothetical protein